MIEILVFDIFFPKKISYGMRKAIRSTDVDTDLFFSSTSEPLTAEIHTAGLIFLLVLS